MILEVHPRKFRPHLSHQTDSLQILEKGHKYEMVELQIKQERFKPTTFSKLGTKLGLPYSEVEGICNHLLKENRVVQIEEDTVIHQEFCDRLKNEILERLDQFHKDHPENRGASLEEIYSKSSLPFHRRLYEVLLERLKEEGKIEIDMGRMRLAGFQPKFSERQKHIYNQLDRACKEFGFRPLPTSAFQEIKDRYGEKEVEAVLKVMIAAGKVIRLNNHRLIHSDAIEEIKEILKGHIEKKGRVTLGESIDLLGIGRTQAQPIFEYLDSLRFTMRIGDYRILYGRVTKKDDHGTECPINEPFLNRSPYPINIKT